jgi:hypothetical protein
MEPNVKCESCGWEGYDMELVSKTEDMNDTDFSFCPVCGSDDILDTDYDEEG